MQDGVRLGQLGGVVVEGEKGGEVLIHLDSLPYSG